MLETLSPRRKRALSHKTGLQTHCFSKQRHTNAVVVLVAASLGVGIVPLCVEREPMAGIASRPQIELPEAISLVTAWRNNGLDLFIEASVKCLKGM